MRISQTSSHSQPLVLSPFRLLAWINYSDDFCPILTFNAALTSLLTFLFFPPHFSFIILFYYLLVSSIDFKMANVAVFPTTTFKFLTF